MALPTFFIIGAAKAGTTSLHFYLGLHPEVQMSANKEPNFFGGPENGIPYPPRRVSRLRDYEALFDPSFAVRGEASVGYTNHPRRQGVPERIKHLVPGAKFLYIVRDPIARTVSHYQDAFAIGKQRRPLNEVLGSLDDPYSPLTCHSRYATQLELYRRAFSPERIMVIDQAELLRDRLATLREIFRFLAVEDTFVTPAFDERLHRSEDRPVYSAGYWHFAERFVSPATRRIPAAIRKSARRRVERALLPKLPTPTLDPDRRAALEDLYRDEVARLRELTGKSFPTWSI